MLKRSLDIEANTLDIIDHTPTVFPPNSKPYGSSYAEWSIKWWKWVVSIPRKDNPGEDKTGTNSGLGQRGPVWFLAGTFENLPIAERKCTIPFGKAIFFPVIVSEKSFAEFPELKTESQAQRSCKRGSRSCKQYSRQY